VDQGHTVPQAGRRELYWHPGWVQGGFTGLQAGKRGMILAFRLVGWG